MPVDDSGPWTTVCATAHRPQHLGKPAQRWTREKLLRAAVWCRDERGTKIGLSGMAVGGDLWWADAVVQAGLILGAHIPCPQQPDPWRADARREWRRLLALADPQHTPPPIADRYSAQAMHARDQRMLEASNAVVCVWRPEKRDGGTWETILKAHKLKMPGVHLDPGRQIVRRGLPSIEEVR